MMRVKGEMGKVERPVVRVINEDTQLPIRSYILLPPSISFYSRSLLTVSILSPSHLTTGTCPVLPHDPQHNTHKLLQRPPSPPNALPLPPRLLPHLPQPSSSPFNPDFLRPGLISSWVFCDFIRVFVWGIGRERGRRFESGEVD